MDIKKLYREFEEKKRIRDSALLTFAGVDGYDVYNCSVPFAWNGNRYMYGRVERRNEWARSTVHLFTETGRDRWTAVGGSPVYQLEDPFVAKIGGILVLGGTHVRMKSSRIDTYYGYFYRGSDLNDLVYFTTGPDRMKDIRLVELGDGRIGVFSRPRGGTCEDGAASAIGFSVIRSLDELTAEVIDNAPRLRGLFGPGEWGGPNQAYFLSSGKIGVIGHMSWEDTAPDDGETLQVYVNSSFVLDPDTREILDFRIIGCRSCYPASEPKLSRLRNCTFTSGIEMRPDGSADLYSGVCDAAEGRITIDDPFSGYGSVVGGISKA